VRLQLKEFIRGTIEEYIDHLGNGALLPKEEQE
jgi:hypothetical protein